MQRGMVYHSLLAPQSGLYIQQLVGRLRERMDGSAFRAAWQWIVDRHTALRMRFRLNAKGEFRQDAPSEAAPKWTEEDWSGVRAAPPEDASGAPLFQSGHLGGAEALLRRFLREDRRRGFDLSRSPLMRLALFHLAEEDQAFVWTYHHALLDGRSQFRVLTELFACYGSLVRGRPFEAAPVPAYEDFLRWLGQEDFRRARGFWEEALRGFEGPTRLPYDRDAEHTEPDEDEHGAQEFVLDEAFSARLRAFAADNDLTPGTLFYGSWGLLLGQYAGAEDVVFGVMRACRHSPVPGSEAMVGLLINTVPLRVRLGPNERVLPWLKAIRSHWVAMRPYEHTPLDEIQAWLGFGPRRPLFETLLTFENTSWREDLLQRGASPARREFRTLVKGNFPLAAQAYAGSRFLLRIGYDRWRFDDATIARMLGHWATVLAGLADRPDGLVSDLPLLTAAERHTMLVAWNRTDTGTPEERCLHRLVETQAARTPEKPAVLFDGPFSAVPWGSERLLTYDGLNRRANRLAHHLRSLGVGPEVRVAVCLRRTPALIVGVLAILKAGGAYVPLDSEYPPDHLATMLAESGARLLVTEAALLDRFSAARSPGVRIVCLESET